MRFWTVVLACALAGCGRAPESYAPPVQRPAEAISRGGPPLAIIDLADPESASYIVAGMRDFAEGMGWRWTHERAELRFPLPRPDGWRFRMEFSLPNVKITGPVTVSAWINGHPLETRRYEAAGDYWIEKPVPPEWVSAETAVAIQAAPPWVDPGPAGEKLGLVLSRVGFLR